MDTDLQSAAKERKEHKGTVAVFAISGFSHGHQVVTK
jgi:hypothetical protein